MDLDLTDEQEIFRETTRRFLEAEAPVAGVRNLVGVDYAFDSSLWRKAAGLGWTSMLASEEAGGGCLSGRPVADAAIVAEGMGRQGSPGPFCPVNVVTAALSVRSSEHLGLLGPLISGASVASWAFAEPGRSWDARSVGATAKPCSDGVGPGLPPATYPLRGRNQ